ncbi:MAG: 30S ribosomal protein S16 [Candidatus Vogelbacteria bacterium]
MLMIRLQRVGRKHETAFRVVVVDSRRGTKSGRTLETVGSYDPRRGKPVLKTERIKYWLSVGTQASGTVHNLLVDAKILDKTKVNVLPKRKPKTKSTASAIIEPAVPVEPLPVNS